MINLYFQRFDAGNKSRVVVDRNDADDIERVGMRGIDWYLSKHELSPKNVKKKDASKNNGKFRKRIIKKRRSKRSNNYTNHTSDYVYTEGNFSDTKFVESDFDYDIINPYIDILRFGGGGYSKYLQHDPSIIFEGFRNSSNIFQHVGWHFYALQWILCIFTTMYYCELVYIDQQWHFQM